METSNMEDDVDLEAQLYGQVQHGSTSEPTKPNAACTGQRLPNSRYWAPGQTCWQKKNINPFAGLSRAKKDNLEKAETHSKTELQPFKPYSPLLFKPVDTPETSEVKKEVQPSKKTRNEYVSRELTQASNIVKRCKPSNRNMARLTKVMRYQLKKMKAAQSKEKRRNCNIETISLHSSEDENEVVEIPLPAPPTVTIDSSDESDSALSPFLEPQTKRKIAEKSSSRCVSPSSVVSDDFIGHIDRSRLLEQKDVADDEDLLYLQESVGNFLSKRNSNSSTLRTNIQSGSFEAPKKRNNIQKNTDYNVTHPNFRATDVYESESSDMLDCDQDTICLQQKNSIESDSPIEITNDRNKKLTKRRTLSNVRESNSNNSSGTEDESFENVGMHQIALGEAVERKKNVMRNRAQILNDGPSSDSEFIYLLKTVSQPVTARRISSESDKLVANDNEDISAGKIAEEVLKGSTLGKATNEADAIPSNTEDIDKLFDSIDKIHTTIESVTNTEEPEQIEPEYVGDEQILSLSDMLEESSVQRIESNDNNGLHIVFTHGKNVGWSEEMIRFYSWSWGQEKFNVRNIRKMMSLSSNWMISTQDRYPKIQNHRNLKCHNCCEFGHIRARCPQPKKELVCYMCGEKGHMEPRCPNTICLRCGKKTNFFTKCCKMCSHENRLICPICKIRGHSIQLCPDKWRRYHSTTEPNDYPNKNFESNQNKYCCICARKGHLSDNCKSALRFSEYPPAISEIKSYAKAYDDDLIKFPFGRNMIGYALLSHPCDKVLFSFSSEVTTKQYYGRFLNAVGLDYLMTWNKNQKQLKHKTNSEHVEGEPDCKITKNNYVVNPFAQKLKKYKKQVEENPNSVECEAASKATDGVTKIPIEMDKTTEENIETTIDETSQYKNSTLETEISYNKFSKDITDIQSTPNLKNKCRELEILPDFIPINIDSSEMDEYGGKNMVGISKNVQPNWKKENTCEKTNKSCEAKLYLTKLQSSFLFSVEGNKFLTENCKKYNMKAKMEWTSVGYVLIIEGLPSDQDNFHNEFLNINQMLSNKTKQQEIEKSQNVPKKREAIIRFLQQDLAQLEKNLGNVEFHYKRLQAVQNQQTKNAFKVADRIRRLLNMILIGQAGLKEGKASLQAIMNNIQILKDNVDMDIVPDYTRREIYEHWRCIFSSQQHDNYEDLIQQYRVLKRGGELSKINLDRRLLDEKFLDVCLTDEQKEKLSAESPLETNVKSIPPKEDVTNNKNDVDLATEPQTSKSVHTQRKELKPRSFISEQIQGVNNSWRHRCKNLIQRLDEPRDRWIPTHFQEHANLKAPSIFWSRESMKFIDKCLAMNPSSLAIISKLERVQEKAKQGLLSNNDYRAILQIHNALRGAFV